MEGKFFNDCWSDFCPIEDGELEARVCFGAAPKLRGCIEDWRALDSSHWCRRTTTINSKGKRFTKLHNFGAGKSGRV